MVDVGTLALGIVNVGITAAAPLLIAALGEAFAQRSGVMNLAIEGIMSVGAAVAYVVGFTTGNPWLALLAALFAGTVIGLVNVFLSQTLYLDQVVTGMSLYIFAFGLSVFIFRASTTNLPLAAQRIPRLVPIDIPILSQIPILGETLFHQNIWVYIAVVMVVILEVVMFKTTIGLNLRAVGENPRAADNVGINVYLVRYLAVMWSGAAAGLGGGYLALELGTFQETLISGRGWIAIAIVIFGQWSPVKILGGSLIFGLIDSLQLHVSVIAPRLPYQFLSTLPFVLSIAIFVIAFRRASLPAALFRPYRREEIR